MAWFTLNKNKKQEIVVSSEDAPLISKFSTPFNL